MSNQTLFRRVLSIMIWLSFVVYLKGQVAKGTHFFAATPPTPDQLGIVRQQYPSNKLFDSDKQFYREVSLSATYGFFVRNNLLIKSDFVYALTPGSKHWRGLYLKPAVRYYYPIADSTMQLFAEVGASNFYSRRSKGEYFRGEFSVGLNKMITNRVGLELAINYRKNLFWDNEETSREILFHSGLAVYLGKQQSKKEIYPAVRGGTIALGATSFGLVRYNDSDWPGTRLYFTPQITYFLTRRLGLGLGLGFNYDNHQSISFQVGTRRYEDFRTDEDFLISPRIRYQLLKKRFVILYMEAGANFEYQTTHAQTLDLQPYTDKTQRKTVYLGPILSIFLTNQLALEVGLLPRYDLRRETRVLNSQVGIQVFLPR